jgi:antitoxin ParD1/3/4
MSSNTMSFALPEALREYIDQRVRSGHYGNTSEYLRELIRRDQDEQAKKRLRELIAEGLSSGPGRALTPKRTAQLKKQVLGERMFDAAIAALEPIERMPSMSSPRLGQLCDIPGLRSCSMPTEAAAQPGSLVTDRSLSA